MLFSKLSAKNPKAQMFLFVYLISLILYTGLGFAYVVCQNTSYQEHARAFINIFFVSGIIQFVLLIMSFLCSLFKKGTSLFFCILYGSFSGFMTVLTIGTLFGIPTFLMFVSIIYYF